MIGVYFKQRRREFLEFAAVNPIDYEEILDPADEEAFSQFSSIFTDDPAFSAGSFDVIVIDSQDISSVFSPYIKKHKLKTVYTKERFYNAIFYYFERVYKKCVPVTAKSVESIPQTKQGDDSVAPSFLKRSIIDQIDEISKEVNSEDSFSTDIDSLAEEKIDEINIEPVQPEYVQEPVQPIQQPQPAQQEYMPQPPYQPQPVPPEPAQQFQSQPIYQPQQVPPMYSQQPYMQMPQGYPMQNQGYAQPVTNQPFGMPQYGQYPQPEMNRSQPPFYQQDTAMFSPQAGGMEFGAGFVPAAMPQQPMISREPLRSGNVQMRRRGTSTRKRLGAPIYTFSSLTDKAGTTTVAFLLAKAMAVQNPNLKIIYLDLNLSNPNTISNHLGYGMSDATLVNVATATNIDFTANLSLLTDTMQASNGCTFSMITFGETTFKQKTYFLTIDYSQFLDILADSFDVVLVDIGKLQGTLAYQHLLMQSPLSKHILVADGSSSNTLNTFITATRGLMYSFEVVVNKSVPTVGTFLLNKQLGIAPLGVIGNHNNTMRFITDAVPFDGTPMQKELWALGGAL